MTEFLASRSPTAGSGIFVLPATGTPSPPGESGSPALRIPANVITSIGDVGKRPWLGCESAPGVPMGSTAAALVNILEEAGSKPEIVSHEPRVDISQLST